MLNLLEDITHYIDCSASPEMCPPEAEIIALLFIYQELSVHGTFL